MSHLRPVDPATGGVKPYADYSPEERLHAVVQIEDGAKTEQAIGQKTSPETVELVKELAQGTPRAETNIQLSGTVVTPGDIRSAKNRKQ